MSPRERLNELIDLMSEYECEHIAALVDDTAAGDRFWETDIAVVYNEYVKGRFRDLGPAPPQAFGAQPPDDVAAGTLPPPDPAANSAGPSEEGIFAPIPIVKAVASVRRVKLPPAREVASPLGELLLTRRTKRDFGDDDLTTEELSTLLHLACGVSGRVSAYGYDRLPLRTFPSSGGLQAPEVYVSIQSVEGLESGLYHYHPLAHSLDLLRDGAYGTRLRELALGQPWVEAASVVLVISGCYERLRWKYGERAYRFICVDAGALAQNVQLAAEGLGLGACAIAGFADDAVERLFGIDGREEMVLLLVCLGATPRNS
jgi:SagB-type dehydrogenase family enzyme